MKSFPLLLLPFLCWSAAAAAAEPALKTITLPAATASAPLSVLAQQGFATEQAEQHVVMPLRLIGKELTAKRHTPIGVTGSAPASALQAAKPSPDQPKVYTGGTAINREGIASNFTTAPADPNGAVGEAHYVQWVNTRLAIFDKATGALVLGPVPGNTVFAGFTGSPGADACRESNNGDPIVQYDKLAKRWLLTQFAWAAGNTFTGPYYQCIAVSTSSDPTGSYYRYVLETRSPTGSPVFPDYPKVGVWPDAYYFTFVLFENAAGGFLGPRACGLDRSTMLTGSATTGLCADLGTDYGVLLPSDLDGTKPPPDKSPNYLMSLDFTADGTGDHLFMWRFSFAKASISSAITVPVAPFTIACPSLFGGPCIEQPAPGERLDALGDRLMYRLAYRNFGDREALVVNHSVQQAGVATDGPVGVRWYEVRNPAGAVGVYQQGTWAPDGNSRWMGSVAMDRMGNIALGYSVSGPATPPGVRYTGRLRTEPMGRLENEDVIVGGGGVQVDTFNRWGDYSAMSVDPVKDCAFWYTQQYIAATGSFNWHTRIAGFNFVNCK